MSRTTEYWFEVQEEMKEKWIKGQLGDAEADEFTEGWEEPSNQYDLNLERLREEAEFEAEYQWIKEQSYSELHENFAGEMSTLKDLVSMQVAFHQESAFFKMAYAHAVTLLETFLGDTVISLVLDNKKYFSNAIKNIRDLKEVKFTISQVLEERDGAAGLATKELSKVLYHNMPKVKAIIESILGTKLEVKIGRVGEIVSIRHDIVHRNGRTMDGEHVHVDREVTLQAIEDIE